MARDHRRVWTPNPTNDPSPSTQQRGPSPQARLGTVILAHHFRASLTRHIQVHCCVLDGVCDRLDHGEVRFRREPAPTVEETPAIGKQVRPRVEVPGER
jgi:hypothetical protein